MAKVLPFARRPETDDLFDKLSTEDKSEWNVRMKLGTAVNNVPNSKKLEVLIAALEYEMWDVWGSNSPVSVTITPRPSGLDINCRRRKSAE